MYFNCYVAKSQPDKVFYLMDKTLHQKLKEIEKINPKKIKGGIANILLNFYQKHLSIQFSANCLYETSCSHYARETFQKYGFIESVLISADRLTRCSGYIWKDTPPFLINNKGRIVDHP